jgi:radial spoke head protein 9
MQIEMALNTLQSKSECEELQFWGKINGLKNDYYIAVAIRYRDMFEFPVKTFYWALGTDFEFKEMPSLNLQHNDVIDADNAYFMGEPAKMLVQVNKPGDGEGEEEAKEEVDDEEGQEAKAAASDETEEEEIKVPQRDLTGK